MAAFNGLVTAVLVLLSGRSDVLASTWESARALGEAGALAELVLAVVTAVVFLRWLSKTVAVTDALEVGRAFLWTPFQAVVAFFIPFVSLVRPYQVLRDLHDHLAPANVPEPAPRPRLDGAAGYRRVEMVHAPRAGAVHHAAIGAWWGLYILSAGLGRFAPHVPAPGPTHLVDTWRVLIVSDMVAVAAALLAVLMVRAIDSRLAERHRRVRYASDEELSGRLVERDRWLRHDLAKGAGLEGLQ